MCRLQMPILVVPMTRPKNGSAKAGYCDTAEPAEAARRRRAVWQDPENMYDHWTYAIEEEVANDLKESERNLNEAIAGYEHLREKHQADIAIERRAADGEGFSFFSKRSFNWNAQIQAQLLASYGYGNAPGNFVGGIVAIKWGPKKSVLWTSLIAAVLSLISPFLAQLHWGALCVSRVMIGFASGVTFPACHTMVAKWAPPDEKSRFVWSLLGGTFGTIITYPMVAAIADSINWQAGWYLPSLLMLVWVGFWALLVSDSPEEHPGISEAEKDYIIR